MSNSNAFFISTYCLCQEPLYSIGQMYQLLVFFKNSFMLQWNNTPPFYLYQIEKENHTQRKRKGKKKITTSMLTNAREENFLFIQQMLVILFGQFVPLREPGTKWMQFGEEEQTFSGWPPQKNVLIKTGQLRSWRYQCQNKRKTRLCCLWPGSLGPAETRVQPRVLASLLWLRLIAGVSSDTAWANSQDNDLAPWFTNLTAHNRSGGAG